MMNALHSFALFVICLASVEVFADFRPFHNSEAYMQGAYGNYTRQRYLSHPDLVGPVANILVEPQPGVSPSKYIMWAPGGPHVPQTHPIILDAHTLSTVWVGPALGHETVGPTVQSCNGSDYITWWSGVTKDGYKQGSFFICNDKYEMVYNLTGAGDLELPDAHEIFLTPQCTAIYTVYKNRAFDLTRYNISEGYIMDSYFQEVDLATGELLFQWSATEHVEVTDAIWEPHHLQQGHTIQNGYDFFHINSVEKDHKGNYLISGRHTCTVYYISGKDGSVIWRIGGNSHDFLDISNGQALNFKWQHHARWIDPELTKMSLYDDRATAFHHDKEDHLSRGIILQLDYDRMTVELTASYSATHAIESIREGSTQVLLDSPSPGNVINGYGQEPGWTEYAPDGRVLMDVMIGPIGLDRRTADNYRAIKVNFTGNPTWSPRIAPGPRPAYVFGKYHGSVFEVLLEDDQGAPLANDTVYFSWNGATDVVAWVVLASNDTCDLTVAEHVLAEVPKTGFENHLHVGTATRFVSALALNDRAEVVGRTPTLDMGADHESLGGEEVRDGDARTLDVLTAQWRAHIAPPRPQRPVRRFLAVACLALLAAAVGMLLARVRRGGGVAWAAIGVQNKAWLSGLRGQRSPVLRTTGWYHGERYADGDSDDDEDHWEGEMAEKEAALFA